MEHLAASNQPLSCTSWDPSLPWSQQNGNGEFYEQLAKKAEQEGDLAKAAEHRKTIVDTDEIYRSMDEEDKRRSQKNKTRKIKGIPYTVGHLEEAAKKTGKSLYGEHLFFSPVESVRQHQFKEGLRSKNVDYVFFPSTPGKGIDIYGRSKKERQQKI